MKKRIRHVVQSREKSSAANKTGPQVATSAPSLTDKQVRFVAEYLIDLNAAGAARRAGYSEKVAEQQGYENLRKPEIAAAISAGKTRQLDSADLSAARVLEELRRLAFVDVAGYYTDSGQPKPISEFTVEQRSALQSIDVVIKNVAAGDGITDTIHKIKIHDKGRSLEMLAKHFELLVDRVKVDDVSGAARVARLQAARARLAGKK